MLRDDLGRLSYGEGNLVIGGGGSLHQKTETPGATIIGGSKSIVGSLLSEQGVSQSPEAVVNYFLATESSGFIRQTRNRFQSLVSCVDRLKVGLGIKERVSGGGSNPVSLETLLANASKSVRRQEARPLYGDFLNEQIGRAFFEAKKQYSDFNGVQEDYYDKLMQEAGSKAQKYDDLVMEFNSLLARIQAFLEEDPSIEAIQSYFMENLSGVENLLGSIMDLIGCEVSK